MEAALDGALGCREGEGIGGEGVGRAAVEVARELVEQDQERQRALGGLAPAGQVAAGGLHVQRLEAVPDRLVEGVVLGEPFLGASLDPEGDDIARIHGRVLAPGILG